MVKLSKISSLKLLRRTAGLEWRLLPFFGFLPTAWSQLIQNLLHNSQLLVRHSLNIELSRSIVAPHCFYHSRSLFISHLSKLLPHYVLFHESHPAFGPFAALLLFCPLLLAIGSEQFLKVFLKALGGFYVLRVSFVKVITVLYYLANICYELELTQILTIF